MGNRHTAEKDESLVSVVVYLDFKELSLIPIQLELESKGSRSYVSWSEASLKAV